MEARLGRTIKVKILGDYYAQYLDWPLHCCEQYPTETTIKNKVFILAYGFNRLQRHGIASNSVHGSRIPSYHSEPESRARMRYKVLTSEVH